MKISEIYNNKKFENFYNMLVETNKQFNLTSITEKDDVYVKHFFDSLIIESEFDKNARVVDVGTGAGFPSIPLAIWRDDLQITAIDALNKRINFVNEVKNTLNLTNLTAIHARSEELAKTEREKFDLATSRAVANLSTLLEWLAPLVKVDGKVICYKGRDVADEIYSAKNAAKELGLSLEKIFEYNLGVENSARTLVVYKKVAKTPLKYPRACNKALKEPIK